MWRSGPEHASWSPEGYRRCTVGAAGRDTSGRAGCPEDSRRLGTAWHGCGPFTHTESRDRPAEVFGCRWTLHTVRSGRLTCCCPVITVLRSETGADAWRVQSSPQNERGRHAPLRFLAVHRHLWVRIALNLRGIEV